LEKEKSQKVCLEKVVKVSARQIGGNLRRQIP